MDRIERFRLRTHFREGTECFFRSGEYRDMLWEITKIENETVYLWHDDDFVIELPFSEFVKNASRFPNGYNRHPANKGQLLIPIGSPLLDILDGFMGIDDILDI